MPKHSHTSVGKKESEKAYVYKAVGGTFVLGGKERKEPLPISVDRFLLVVHLDNLALGAYVSWLPLCSYYGAQLWFLSSLFTASLALKSYAYNASAMQTLSSQNKLCQAVTASAGDTCVPFERTLGGINPNALCNHSNLFLRWKIQGLSKYQET